MDILQVNRALLNPKFEGYKLDLVENEEAIATRVPLQYHASQSTFSGSATSGPLDLSPLSFVEMRSRISHNHLSVSNSSSDVCLAALYVDAEFKIIQITLEPTGPNFSVIHELPRPVTSASNGIIQHAEYPSAFIVNDSFIIASDGHGLLYLLGIVHHPGGDSSSSTYSLLGTYTLPSGSLLPFKIHTIIASPESSAALIILSARNYTSPPPTTSNGSHHHHLVEFDVFGINLPLAATAAPQKIQPLSIAWHRRGTDVPMLVYGSPDHESIIILGGSSYSIPGVTSHPSSYEPSSDEMAPIPRANEDLDEKPMGVVTAPLPPPPPPYSWTQTQEDVSVAFALPSTITKTDIQVSFSSSSLTLNVAKPSSSRSPDAVDNFPPKWPQYTNAALWDLIHPASSYWTWDKDDTHTLGLLTLHLDKQNPSRPKWMHVFGSSQLHSQEEVPETLDPSEMWKIRESLEKYTAAFATGGNEDPGGFGFGLGGGGIPSLAQGEMDMEVDEEVGRRVYVSWVSPSSSSSPPPLPSTTPIQLLSTPLPGLPNHSNDLLSLIIRESVDGPQFLLTPSSEEPQSQSQPLRNPNFTWKHDYTFAALAFVIASKQDARFIHHIHSKAVLVFESCSSSSEQGGRSTTTGGGAGGAGNLYIYRAAPKSSLWAKQSILKLGQGTGGALLGVGMVANDTLLCLFERELAVIRNARLFAPS